MGRNVHNSVIRTRLRREIATNPQVALGILAMTVLVFLRGKQSLPLKKVGLSLRTP